MSSSDSSTDSMSPWYSSAAECAGTATACHVCVASPIRGERSDGKGYGASEATGRGTGRAKRREGLRGERSDGKGYGASEATGRVTGRAKRREGLRGERSDGKGYGAR